MTIQHFTFNPLQENTYVVYDETREAIIIDPGCYEKEEQEELRRFINWEKLSVKKLVNTHCHIDHVLGNAFIMREYNVDLYIHRTDLPTLESNLVVAPLYGFHGYEHSTTGQFLAEGDLVEFGNSKLRVLFVPGHAPGHIALVNEEENLCISGDVLFYQSIGRTDLPGGSFSVLIDSIHSKLFSLPEETRVYCGHGPATSIGFEKQFNPFCGINASI